MDEAPVFLNLPAAIEVALTTTAAGDLLYAVIASDPDGDDVTYSLSNANGTAFSIDAASESCVVRRRDVTAARAGVTSQRLAQA